MYRISDFVVDFHIKSVFPFRIAFFFQTVGRGKAERKTAGFTIIITTIIITIIIILKPAKQAKVS